MNSAFPAPLSYPTDHSVLLAAACLIQHEMKVLP